MSSVQSSMCSMKCTGSNSGVFVGAGVCTLCALAGCSVLPARVEGGLFQTFSGPGGFICLMS